MPWFFDHSQFLINSFRFFDDFILNVIHRDDLQLCVKACVEQFITVFRIILISINIDLGNYIVYLVLPIDPAAPSYPLFCDICVVFLNLFPLECIQDSLNLGCFFITLRSYSFFLKYLREHPLPFLYILSLSHPPAPVSFLV